MFGMVLTGLCALGLLGLAAQVSARGLVVEWDRRLLAMVDSLRSPGVLDVFAVLTWLGDSVLLMPLALVVGIGMGWSIRSRAPVVLLVLASTGTYVTVELIKVLIARPRPPALQTVVAEDGFGFPSGHSAHSTAVYLVIACLLVTILPALWQRISAVAVAVLLIVTTMCSRVVLGVHSPSDVVAGLLLGVAITAFLLGIYHHPTRRIPAPTRS